MTIRPDFPTRPRIAFEVAGPEHGFGHLARSLALARALGEWADITFHPAEIPNFLAVSYPDLRCVPGTRADAIVIDTPESDRREHLVNSAREQGQTSILIADGETDVRPDVVICPGPHATELAPHFDDVACALLGPSYAMLHPAFRPRDAAPTWVRRAAVSLGGCTTPELLQPIMCGLTAKGIEVQVLLPTGLGLPRFPTGVNVYVAQSADAVARLFASADLVVVSAGVASLEALATATPMGVVSLTEQHEPIAAWYERLGVARDLGLASALAEVEIADLAIELDRADGALEDQHQRAREIDAANGCLRVSAVLKEALT